MRAWDFAREVYDHSEVRTAALELQDRHGHCVSFLLWRLWAAHQGCPINASIIDLAVKAAKTVETHALGPSRAIRAFLKADHPLFAGSSRAQAREAIGTGELAVERLLIETLEALTPAPLGSPTDPRQALAQAARAWGSEAPPELLARLARAC